MSPCEKVFFFSPHSLQTLLRCHSFRNVLSFSSRCQGNNGSGKAGACDTAEGASCRRDAVAAGRLEVKAAPAVQKPASDGFEVTSGTLNIMLRVFDSLSCRKKRADVIPIQTVLIPVILLSYTYYLPPRPEEKKKKKKGSEEWSFRLKAWRWHCGVVGG